MAEDDAAEMRKALARARMKALYYRDLDVARKKNRERQAKWLASDPAHREKAVAYVRAWRARRKQVTTDEDQGGGRTRA